jgi:hypothetical protein
MKTPRDSAERIGRRANSIRVGLLLMIAASARAFASILALPPHSLHGAHQVDLK